MSADTFGSLLSILGICLGIVMLVLLAASLVWVYLDAQKRGKTGCLWLLIAFFTWPFGVVAYLVLRDKTVQL
ncbi:MAG: hypothetical protein A2W37_05960 [Chloroflexi bacterium RBG_16_63_12]|nr:hypothetical protein [Anaerolineales bacterium]OGO50608.1 MAG: hypothetical protein A2W37_05960 [Chloroflexi bacterium RBG_16_63_12]